MYAYQPVDQAIVDARVDEFRDQVRRYRAGQLTDDEFLQLRLRNGLYKQRLAYMLRVAIPYGMLTSDQLRKLAHISRAYDKGYGHFTTRQNIQYNWPELDEVPDLLAELAEVQMHAIQTSGNCVRNTTSDPLAGIAADEVEDPRPWAEMIRQWSTLHAEFNFLPRKFKIAITGAREDRAAIAFHDIGLRLVRNDEGEVGFEVYVGGGLGRTPVIAPLIREFLPREELLRYLEAILRVYNVGGDRQNKYKARIKIQVRKLGPDAFRAAVDAEHERLNAAGALGVTEADVERFRASFQPPPYRSELPEEPVRGDTGYLRWRAQNVLEHRVAGYSAVVIPLKGPLDGRPRPPGDVTADEMDAVADLADRFSFGELRSTHEQNLLLGDVETHRLPALFDELTARGLASPNAGLLTDMICCPGLEFCNLANAESIPIAKAIAARLDGTDKLVQIGAAKLKMSGCVNACGHHHAGHIGILGVDKKGEQGYQILLGGSAENDASIGRWVGPALPAEDVPDAIEAIADVYLEQRQDGESLLGSIRRLGLQPFHDRIYGGKPADEDVR